MDYAINFKLLSIEMLEIPVQFTVTTLIHIFRLICDLLNLCITTKKKHRSLYEKPINNRKLIFEVNYKVIKIIKNMLFFKWHVHLKSTKSKILSYMSDFQKFNSLTGYKHIFTKTLFQLCSVKGYNIWFWILVFIS